MTVSHREKAKKDLAVVIVSELSSKLGSREHSLSRETLSALSMSVAEQIMSSHKVMEQMARLLPPPGDDWLTTEDAAKMSGFSRPLIAALLDGKSFEGKVHRTDKGHRRVLASDFRSWLEKNKRPEGLPKTLKDVRSGPRYENETDEDDDGSGRQPRKSTAERPRAKTRSLGPG